MTTPLSRLAAWLEKELERAEKATPGPWVAERGPVVALGPPSPKEYEQSLAVTAKACTSRYGVIPHGVVHKDDAEFIADVRTAHPRLVRLARVMLAVIEKRGGTDVKEYFDFRMAIEAELGSEETPK